MNVLEKFLNHRQSKKQAEHLTAWGQYRQLLECFHRGDEVDADAADRILQAVNKSESDLQSDVATLSQRYIWRDQIVSGEIADANRISAQKEIENCQRKIDDLVGKLTPKLDSTRAAMADADRRQANREDASGRLLASALNPDLISEAESLNQERREMVPKIREIEDLIRKCNLEYHGSMVEHWRFEKANRSQFDEPSKKYCHDRLRAAIENLDRAKQHESTLRSKLSEYTKRMSETESELDELRRQMLIP